MSEWRLIKLGDIADFSNGINFDKSAYSSGVPLIGVSNFGDRFSPSYDELEQVKIEIVRDSDYLREGDIVFVRSNGNKELVGRCMLIRNCPERVTYSGFCIRCRLRNLAEYDPVFFTYYFKSYLFRRAMTGTAVGANIQNLSQNRLSSHIAKIPDIDSQHCIASILSAYDSLIETNQRQIKLLEEAAQRLYKEWFVDLRYPGHENVPVVDGVPEGWKQKKVTDLLQIKYGKDHKSLSDGDIPVYGSGGIMRRVKPILYSGESVLIPRKGSLNNILFVDGDFWTIDTMFYSVPQMENIAKYCYLFLSRLDMYSFNIGAAVPSMTVNILDGIDILLPCPRVLAMFEDHMKRLFEQKKILIQQNEFAAESRDRLLPKLMSGEITV